MDFETVKEGNHVVLMKSFDSGNMKIAPVVRNSVVHYGKFHFDPSPLIGCRYGSVFRIHDGTMTLIENFAAYENEIAIAIAQKSATHEDKSQFSQEKIIKKKKKLLHSNVVTVIRPSLLLLNEMLYARDKLGGLRIDTLSQILTLANVQNGSRCLVVDNNLGMLTSAIMSRCVPDGLCIQLVSDHESIYTTRNTLSMLNFGNDICGKKLLAITIRDLYRGCQAMEDIFSAEDLVMRSKHEHHLERLNKLLVEREGGDMKTPCNSDKMDVESETDETVERAHTDSTKTRELISVVMKKEANREARSDERIKVVNQLRTDKMDCLLIASPSDHPLALLKLLWPFLETSGQFVIYNDSIQPLVECRQFLKSATLSLAVSLTLSESWLRKLQVLPDRTRPEMNVSGFGGYLLSGTKVDIMEEHKS